MVKQNKKEYHFLLSYNADTDYWEHDVDTEDAKFDNKMIFNNNTGKWENGYLGDGKYEENEYELVEIFNQLLEYANNNFRRNR